MVQSFVKWIPVAVYLVVSSIIFVAADRRLDFDSGVVLVIATVQILLAGFFSPYHPYRRASR